MKHVVARTAHPGNFDLDEGGREAGCGDGSLVGQEVRGLIWMS